MAESDQAVGQPPSESPTAGAEGGTARARLLEAAVGEQELGRRTRAAREDFEKRAERLNQDIPALFFRLAQGLREGVLGYNQNQVGSPLGELRYRETPGVALREVLTGQEYLVSVWRGQDRFDLRLNFLNSSRGYQVAIIEGDGSLGRSVRERIMLRIEGWVEGGQTVFWVSFDLKRRPYDLDELPDRILLAVTRGDRAPLLRDPPSLASLAARRRRQDHDADDDLA